MAKKKPTTPAPAPVRWPQHKMGKHCGYELYEDGRIRVADMYADAMNDSMDQENALRSLIKSFTHQCQALMVPITKRQRHFWERIKDDYGIDYETSDYAYDRGTKTVIPKPKAEDKK